MADFALLKPIITKLAARLDQAELFAYSTEAGFTSGERYAGAWGGLRAATQIALAELRDLVESQPRAGHPTKPTVEIRAVAQDVPGAASTEGSGPKLDGGNHQREPADVKQHQVLVDELRGKTGAAGAGGKTELQGGES